MKNLLRTHPKTAAAGCPAARMGHCQPVLGSALRLAVIVVGLGISTATCEASESWEGVDKTVVEKFASEAGHPASEPYINTDQGDLLLFLFLLSGAAGGFTAGYAFRGLFPPKATHAAQYGTECDAALKSPS